MIRNEAPTKLASRLLSHRELKGYKSRNAHAIALKFDESWFRRIEAGYLPDRVYVESLAYRMGDDPALVWEEVEEDRLRQEQEA